MPRQKTLWELSVEEVWIPFFATTNKEGFTTIPEEILAEPFLPDGSVKTALREMVAVVRGNFAASLIYFASKEVSPNPALLKELTKRH